MDGFSICCISLYIFYTFRVYYISPSAHSTVILNFCQYLQGKCVFFNIKMQRQQKQSRKKSYKCWYLTCFLQARFLRVVSQLFACVDLTTLWSITHSSRTFFQFWQAQTNSWGNLLFDTSDSKHCFTRNLKQAIIRFHGSSLLHQPGLAPILRSHVFEKCCCFLLRYTKKMSAKLECKTLSKLDS